MEKRNLRIKKKKEKKKKLELLIKGLFSFLRALKF